MQIIHNVLFTHRHDHAVIDIIDYIPEHHFGELILLDKNNLSHLQESQNYYITYGINWYISS